MIKEKSILALNQRSLKGTTRQIYRAVMGYDPVFDKENFTRILNSIAGKGEFEGRFFRIDGKASLVLRTTKDISKLTEVLAEIESIASKEENISFPKSFVVEKDKSIIEELDAAMLKIVQKYWNGTGGREQLYLEFKDILVQFRCVEFEGYFARKSIEFVEFDLDIIKDAFIKEGLVSIESIDSLERITFSGFNEEGHEEFTETLLDLIVCEVYRKERSYIKIGGRWLRILAEIQQFIDNELKMVNLLRDLLPAWHRRNHPKELDYNQFVAAQKDWVCMDQQCVQNGASKIEVCDIFDKSKKRFFHIKETWGSKSSYLFVQGITSAEFFYNSDTFRKKCEEKWPGQFNDRTNYQVVFGIAADKADDERFPLNMTFFAKWNLYSAIAILKQIGYVTYLAPIKMVANDDQIPQPRVGEGQRLVIV